MKVKLMVGRVGDNFSQNPGQVIDVDEAEARRLIASKQAEAVGMAPDVAAIDDDSRSGTRKAEARPAKRNAKKR